MDVARILVWTKINSLVNGVSNVKIDGKKFSIKIVEDIFWPMRVVLNKKDGNAILSFEEDDIGRRRVGSQGRS